YRHAVVEHVEILLHGGPLTRQWRVPIQARVHLHKAMKVVVGPERCIGTAVDADQLGGDTLAYLGLVVRLGQHDQPRVGVHIDETGADDESLGVDDAPSLYAGEVATQDVDLLAFYPRGAVKAGVPGAIDDQSVAD